MPPPATPPPPFASAREGNIEDGSIGVDAGIAYDAEVGVVTVG
jgi:hypothetical protein